MTGPLSAVLGLGLFGVFCLAFTEKILPVPPSHVLLLFLGMTAAPDGATLAILLMVTTLGSTTGCLFWYAVGRRLGFERADGWPDVSANMSSCAPRPTASWRKPIAATMSGCRCWRNSSRPCAIICR